MQGHSSVQPPGFRDTELLLLDVGLALLTYLCVCPSIPVGDHIRNCVFYPN